MNLLKKFKDYINMSLTVGLKIIVNIILFLFLANIWELSEFGQFMYHYTLSNVLILFVDFGFALKTVKDLSKNTKDPKRIIEIGFKSKLLLTFALILFFLISKILLSYRVDTLFYILLIAAIFNSFGNYFNLPFRATGEFKKEAKNNIILNIVLIFISVFLIMIKASPKEVGFGFIVSYFIFFVISLRYYFTYSLFRFKKVDVLDSLNYIKVNTPYALHIFVGALYFNIDTLLIKALIDPESVALYQAAMRIIMGAMVLNQVFTNVLFPKLNSISNNNLLLGIRSKVFNNILVALGGSLCFIIFFFSESIVDLIYKGDYQYSSQVLEVLSFLVFFRYLGIISGVLLTINNSQYLRVITALLGLMSNIIFGLIFIKSFGVIGAAYAAVISSFIIATTYIFFVYKKNKILILDKYTLLFLTFIIIVLIL